MTNKTILSVAISCILWGSSSVFAATTTTQPTATTTDTPTTTTTDTPTTTTTDKPTTTTTDTPTTTTTDTPTTTTTDTPTTTTTDKPTTTTTDKPTTTTTDKPTTTTTDKPTTTTTDKPTTTTTDKPTTTKPTTTPTPPVKPKLEDFGLTTEDVPKLDAAKVKKLPPKAFGAFDKQQVKDIPPAALAGVKATQLAELAPESVAVLKSEQVNQMPAAAMVGLTAKQIGSLPPVVLQKLPAEHFKNLDDKELQALPPKDLGKLLSNLDTKQIKPLDVKDRLPEGWKMDNKGVLTPPADTVLALKTKPAVKFDATVKVTVPTGVPDLDTVFALGGDVTPPTTDPTDNTKTTILMGLNESLQKAGYQDFVMTQEEGGTLVVVGGGQSEGASFTFTPESDSVKQVAADVPSGLTQDATGHFVITTPEKQQVTVISTPKDPKQVAETLGAAGSLRLDKNGVAMLEMRKDDASPKQVRPVVFDPMITQTSGKTAGIYVSGNTGEIVYADGTAQKIMPTAPLPDKFMGKAKTISGVEEIQLNADGSFSVKYKGQMLKLRPAQFDAQVTPVAEGDKVNTNIEVQADGTVKYTVQDGTDQLDVVLDIIE